MPKWGTKIEIERRRRILLAAWAYAYEIENKPLVSDAEYDREAYLVDLSIDTGNEKLDKFFRDEFDPSTGMWIHKHPEKIKLKAIAALIRRKK